MSSLVGVWDVALDGVCRAARVPRPPRCVVLYYHSIPKNSRQRFARQLDELLARAEPIRLDEPAKLHGGRRYVAVTFDDGLLDVFENAVPELLQRSIPSTHFIVAGALGQRPAWPAHSADVPGEQVVSAKQLQEQTYSPLVCIGSHTVTHPKISALSKDQATWELVESRHLLEQILGRRVDLFSFPYGAFSADSVRWCAEAGYRRVFTSNPSLSCCSGSEYVSGRVSASPTDTFLEFRLKIMGAYRWVPVAIRLKQRWRAIISSSGAPVSPAPRTDCA